MRPKREDLLYHARMLAIAVLGGVAIFLVILGIVFLGLWLGVWHIEDR